MTTSSSEWAWVDFPYHCVSASLQSLVNNCMRQFRPSKMTSVLQVKSSTKASMAQVSWVKNTQETSLCKRPEQIFTPSNNYSVWHKPIASVKGKLRWLRVELLGGKAPVKWLWRKCHHCIHICNWSDCQVFFSDKWISYSLHLIMCNPRHISKSILVIYLISLLCFPIAVKFIIGEPSKILCFGQGNKYPYPRGGMRSVQSNSYLLTNNGMGWGGVNEQRG